jgi:ribosomal protein S18 acetylase RimI-like enzyme
MRSIRLAVAADAAGIAEIHVAAWRETYAGLLPDAMVSARSVADRKAQWEHILGDPAAASVYVAEQDGCIAGFGACGPQRADSLRAQGFIGEITAIYVLRAFHHQGLGSALMRAMASCLLDRAVGAAALWVLKDNEAARRFYERLGGEIVGEQEEIHAHGVLRDIAYGWRDLVSLHHTLAKAPGSP